MLFEVWKNGFCVMGTNQKSCIDDKETLNAMYKAGYRFKLNGKTASINAIMEFMKKPNNVSKKEK